MPKYGLPAKAHHKINNKKIVRHLAVFLLLCAVFVAGFTVRGDDKLLKSLGFGGFAVKNEVNPGMTLTGNTIDSIAARIAEMEGVLKKDSLDDYSLDKVTPLMLGTLANATGDPYLKYFDAGQYQNYLSEVSKSYTGVGVLFGENTTGLYAADVFAGSDAQALGVEVGDILVAINGEKKDWSFLDVRSELNKPEGVKVSLTWRRPATAKAEAGKEFTTSLSTSPTHSINVSSELISGVGYIKVKQLTQDSDVLVRRAIDDLTQQGAGSFVLDLRDNPGGYLSEAVNISSLFLKSGVLVQIQTNDAITTRNATGELATQLPVVVLINKHTAAAAEVLASSLQDNNRASLVGEPTMGKGTVQVVRPFSFGGALRYTAAQYLTPLGREINQIGLTPTNTVANQGAVDIQKDVAIATAQYASK